MRFSKGLLLFALLCVFSVFNACRRNLPSLVDINKPPETELWFAPPESTEYEYKVHLYWRGLDKDGTVVKYIWTITDKIEPIEEERWNPAENLDDLREGEITTRTDSTFSFTAFHYIGGVGVRQSYQAFHIAAIDDNGKIDETPAALEFIAKIDKLPEMKLYTITNWTIDGNNNLIPEDPVEYDPAKLDTVGMYKPFEILFEGSTVNGAIVAYKWFPITDIVLKGSGLWSSDLSKNHMFFLNSLDCKGGLHTINDPCPFDSSNIQAPFTLKTLPNGIFRFAAQCKDSANAESEVDPAQFTKGVCQVVVNFDPDTEIFKIINIYKRANGIIDSVQVDFLDQIPDTVPYGSWITLWYRGWDDERDVKLCEDDINKCIKYQIQYHATSERFSFVNFKTGLLPSEGPQDTNPCDVVDTTSMNIGSLEYEIKVRSVDENGRIDGTPEMVDLGGGKKRTATVNIVGNYNPTLDSLFIEDHMGRKIQDGDTLKWVWSEGSRQFVPDDTIGHFETTLTFNIRAFGHDNPKELIGSGVRTWYYSFYGVDPPGINKSFARAGSWVEGPNLNELDDQFKATFSHSIFDPNGTAIFENPPVWIGINYGGQNFTILYEIWLKGRDTGLAERFSEYVYLRKLFLQTFVCPPDPNEAISERRIQNDYPSSQLGRWTETGTYRFYFQLVP